MYHSQQDLPVETNFLGSDYVVQQSLIEKYSLNSSEVNTSSDINFKNKEDIKSSFCFRKCKKDISCQNSCYSLFNSIYERNNTISKKVSNCMI